MKNEHESGIKIPDNDLPLTPENTNITLVSVPGKEGKFLGGVPQSGKVHVQNALLKYSVLFATGDKIYYLNEVGLVKTIINGKHKYHPLVPFWDPEAMRECEIKIGEAFSYVSQYKENPRLTFSTTSPVTEIVVCDFSRLISSSSPATSVSSDLLTRFYAQ